MTAAKNPMAQYSSFYSGKLAHICQVGYQNRSSAPDFYAPMTSYSTLTKKMTRTVIMMGFTALLPPFLEEARAEPVAGYGEQSGDEADGENDLAVYYENNERGYVRSRRFMALLTPFALVTGMCASAVSSRMRNVPVPGP